jgi:hypothetical protein
VVVWKRAAGDSLEPIQIALGITDHSYTQVREVLKGSLKEGDDLIIRSVTTKPQTPAGLRR